MAERPVPAPVTAEPERPASPVIATTEYHVLRQIAADLIASGYLPKSITKAEQAVAIVTLGRELGMGPWQAFNSIDVIQGRPTLNARGMLSLVKRFVEPRGGWFRIIEATPERATVEYYRPPEPEPRRVVYTLEEARQAGLLGKDSWKQYPLDMLRNRAISRACREGFPDVILGLYTPEEMEAAEPPHAPAAAPVRVVDQRERAATEPAEPASAAMRALHATAKGIASHEQISRLAANIWGVPSLKRLTPAQLGELRAAVAECGDAAGFNQLAQFAAAIDSALDEEDLTSIANAIGAAGLGDARLTLLREAFRRVRATLAMLPHVEPEQASLAGETTDEAEAEVTSWTELWRRTGELYGIRGIADAATFLEMRRSELESLTPAQVGALIEAKANA